MASTFTPAEIAIRFQTDPKTLRRFLRASAKDGWMSERDYQAPGKGARWAIKGAHLNSLRGQFNRWLADQEAARAARAEAASEADPAEAPAEDIFDGLTPAEAAEADLAEAEAEDSDES